MNSAADLRAGLGASAVQDRRRRAVFREANAACVIAAEGSAAAFAGLGGNREVREGSEPIAVYEIHTAAFKSYHTQTPNGYNLQISYVTHDHRLALANAVNPKKVSGQ